MSLKLSILLIKTSLWYKSNLFRHNWGNFYLAVWWEVMRPGKMAFEIIKCLLLYKPITVLDDIRALFCSEAQSLQGEGRDEQRRMAGTCPEKWGEHSANYLKDKGLKSVLLLHILLITGLFALLLFYHSKIITSFRILCKATYSYWLLLGWITKKNEKDKLYLNLSS